MTLDSYDPHAALTLSTEAAELALAEAFDDLARGLVTERRDHFGGRVVRVQQGGTALAPDWRSYE